MRHGSGDKMTEWVWSGNMSVLPPQRNSRTTTAQLWQPGHPICWQSHGLYFTTHFFQFFDA